MKYIKFMRKLHLWLGLILTFFLLVEAATGLILSEPGIIGVNKAQPVSQSSENKVENKSSEIPTLNKEQDSKGIEHAKQVSGDVSTLVFIKQLHQGIIHSQNFRGVVDSIAIGIILLTLTGVYLSIPLLRVQFKRKS